MVIIAALMVLICGILLLVMPHALHSFTPIPLIGIIALMMLLFFGSLTVEVNEEQVRLAFGIGALRKLFEVREIRSVREVRNKWWYGWGIRAGWFFGFNWLYNVSGLDAVEITMINGKIYRIGTDEPENLRRAIEAVMGRAAVGTR